MYNYKQYLHLVLNKQINCSILVLACRKSKDFRETDLIYVYFDISFIASNTSPRKQIQRYPSHEMHENRRWCMANPISHFRSKQEVFPSSI